MKLDLSDGLFVLGLVLLGVGLALWSVPLMLVVEGLVFVILAVALAWRRGKL